MAFIPLAIPPGVVRPGTLYQAKGRWYDSQLVRWHEGALQPVGGWDGLSGADSEDVGGAVRGMFAWKRATGLAYVALGTRNALKVYTGGTLSDITPSGLTAGSTNASGTYYNRTEATSWQLDNYGEDLVAVSIADGTLWYWDSSAGVGNDAAALANAPTGCVGVVVTPERFVFALGASLDRRLVVWCDQEGATSWTPTTSNQAGDFPLATQGQIMAGRRSRQETLIWTDVDLWAARYIGGTLVYAFQQVGEKCGAISRHAMGMTGERAFWMGPRGFFQYDGFARPIECEVGDYVFGRLNRAQASKVCCVVNADFGEVWWFYPSGGENDSYVMYDYLDDHWAIGSLVRTSGIDRGFLQYPLLADADGNVYEHENGSDYGGATDPYIESGPIEIGNGDQVMHVRQIIPDEDDLGEVQTTIYSSFYPTAGEVTHGPYTLTNPTSVRMTGRQVRVRHAQVSGGWRVGTMRLEAVPGGLR